jgi:glycosyltransferase involved in cell wall biosynthesis
MVKIALVAPLYEAVPPVGYGGTERVIAALADELVRRHHDVTLFAAGGSVTTATLVQGSAAALRHSMSRRQLEQVAPHLHLRMLADVYRSVAADDFDIVHAHTDVWTLPFTTFSSVPTVITLHGRLDIEVARSTLALYPDAPLVSISNDQRRAVADLPLRWMATCPNGLDLGAYAKTPASAGRDYLAFVGRITPEKRPDWAVEVARRAGLPLRVAAKIDPLDNEYWETEIEPLFRSADVEFVGEIGEADKPSFFGSAAATLFPIDWPEPFGLVMIESLAAGTPVIALRKGSVPEVLTDGESGFVCDTLDDMVAAVDHLPRLRPDTCRREADRFTASAMADGYLDVYARLVSDGASVSSLPGPIFLLPSASTGS